MQYIQLQIDMALLGHYNPILLSAVGNVLFPYYIHISFLLAISLGTTILISHCVGGDQLAEAQRYTEVSFFYNTLISIIFMIYLYFLTPAILSALGTPDEIHGYAVNYMRILSYSFLLMGIEYSITAYLQGIGITKHIMYAGIIRTVINIVLDWIMIYGLLGFPEMGIDGAAWATTISNFAAAFYFIVVIAYARGLRFKVTLSGIFKPEWKIQKESMRVGLPSGLESILWTVGQIAVIRVVNELDVYSTGLYIVIGRIQAFTFYFYIGIARATMILVGQKMGAGLLKEAKHITYLSLKYSFMLCIVMAILFFTIPEQILSVFTSEKELITRVSGLLYIVSIIIFPVAVNVIFGNAIRGMKDTKWMFYTQSLGTLFVVVTSAILVLVFNFNLMGIFLTILMDETFRGLLNYLRFEKGRGFLKKIFISA